MRGVDDFLVVYVGAGIGAALVMGGEVRRGSHGIAGEIAYLRQNGRTLMERLLGPGITTAGGLSLESLARRLDHRADRNRHLRAKTEAHVVAVTLLRLREYDGRRRLQLDAHFGHRPGERLAGAHEERHALPSPRVDVQPQRRIRRHL